MEEVPDEPLGLGIPGRTQNRKLFSTRGRKPTEASPVSQLCESAVLIFDILFLLNWGKWGFMPCPVSVDYTLLCGEARQRLTPVRLIFSRPAMPLLARSSF